jgi:predicted nuclease of restriction endonuclease-like RecB superfamily
VREAAFEEADAGGAAPCAASYSRATAARRALGPGEPFDRGAVVAAVAAARELPAAEIERRLFADRPGALRLLGVGGLPPAALAAGFELAEAQAVLLRAVRVIAEVRARDADTYRRLFRRLKFLRLLPVVTPARGGGYRLEIDGPFSLFQAVTRTGSSSAGAARDRGVRCMEHRRRAALGETTAGRPASRSWRRRRINLGP